MAPRRAFWKGILCALSWRLAVAGIGFCVLVAASIALLRYYDRAQRQLFSSNASPSGEFVAENFLDGGDSVGGTIVVRRSSGSVFHEAPLNESQPDVFFRWTDDEHLTILSSSQNEPLSGPTEMGPVHVAYSTYPFRTVTAAIASARSHQVLTLDSQSVSATVAARSIDRNAGWKACELQISAKDGTRYGQVGMTIVANVGPCALPGLNGRICGGVSSRFDVGRQSDQNNRQILTSATVSEIPSYNVLPNGSDHRAIRGQFIEGGAVDLVNALKAPSFSIDYVFDFDQLALKYVIPTSAVSGEIDRFETCVGTADFDSEHRLN